MARLEKQAKANAFRIYVTDALQVIAENTAKINGGKTLKKRYYDLLHPQPVDNRSGEEIALDVIKKLGLEVIED